MWNIMVKFSLSFEIFTNLNPDDFISGTRKKGVISMCINTKKSRIMKWFLCCSAWFCFAGLLAAEEKTLWLDEMDLSKTTCGWKQTAANLSVDGNPLTIAGKKYDRGVGHHAPGDILIKIPAKNALRFTAWVGIDDETNGQGHAEFIVYGEKNTILWRSDAMVGKQEPKRIDLDISGLSSIRLHCDTLPEGYGNDHQDWAEAGITYENDGKTLPFIAPFGVGLADDEGNEIERMDETACEWLSLSRQLQAGMPDYVKAEALHSASTLSETDRDPLDVVLRRVPFLVEALESMGKNAPDLTAEKSELQNLTQLAEGVEPTDVSGRRELFAKVTALRNRIALKNPLLDFQNLLFIKRHFNPEPEKEGNHMCDQFFGFHGRAGGGLFVLRNAFGKNPEVVNVLEGLTVEQGRNQGRTLDASWAFLSPELSYDGREILFAAADTASQRHSYTWTEENCYHLFKVQFDPETGKGSHLEQLTDGPYDDFDPCYLPNGRVIFISERRGGFGRCHGRPVPCYTLHSMNADGSDIVMLSPHETNEWQPDVDHQGMVIYTRWDYVDRGFSQAHHPWITTPDGRDPRVIQGNYDREQGKRPHFECDIHPIPGSSKLTATATGHHAQHYGSLILIDTTIPDDNHAGQVRRITPDQQYMESELRAHRDPQNYGTCRALSEQFFLCIYDPFSKADAGTANDYGIYLLDEFGNRTFLYRDPEISCRDVIPVKAHERQNIVPHLTLVGNPLAPGEKFVPTDSALLPKTATVGLMNVYDSMFPFPEDEDGKPAKIQRLRIVQLLPKTTPLANHPFIGYGDQKGARKILGTVPVEPDGSAFFSLPVNIPVYFQALDANGAAVQTMRSATYVHEGEQLTCQGCHENRHSGMPNRPSGPAAMRRAPSEILPDPEGTNPFNYVRLVQPILDAKCVACHAGPETKRSQPNISEDAMNRAAGIDLRSGNDLNAHFTTSYETLRKYCFYYDNAAWTEPQTFPGKFGSNRSPLFTTLKSPHFGVSLTPAEMYRFTTWMDNNCDFYGAYDDCTLQRSGEIVEPKLE